MKKIVLFASGTGSNAEKIILHFKKSSLANVVGIFSNNPHAKVLEIAKTHDIESFLFDKQGLSEGAVLQELIKIQPDLIVLAGFLWKFPETIISKFSNKVINIHPALLPKYGGKGMYGIHVHKAILEKNEKETGITIHYVNENYDEGAFIFQKAVNIEKCKTPEEIAAIVHKLEHQYFSIIIEQLLTSNL